MLVEAPEVQGHFYFLKKGFAMGYTYRESLREVDKFWKPGQIIVSIQSFIEQVPALENIQLMENSEVLCVSYADIQELFRQFPEATGLYRILVSHHMERMQRRVRDTLRLTALQRFEKLLRVFPSIEQTVTQESIASYLGISAQSLSRIKRQQDKP
jgi:CRP-like cAMP-binding protein